MYRGCVASLVLPMAGVAQAVSPADIQTKQDTLAVAKQVEAERQDRLQSSRVSAERIVAPVVSNTEEDSIQFHIDHIILEGQPESFGWLSDHLHAYVHTDMGIFAVQKLMKELNGELMRKGYVTSQIVAPEQSLATGTLRLMVIPGKVHAVTYAKGSVEVPWRNSFPIREGDILNIRMLEQGLEQMKRISSQDVTMKLIPSTVPGETDVELMVTRGKQLHMGVSLDDSGLENTGKLQLSSTLGIDSIFNASDKLSINIHGDGAQSGYHKGTRGYGVNYSIPFGRDTFSVGHNHYTYHQTVAMGISPFISSGKTDTSIFSWDHMVSRNDTNKWAWDIKIAKRHSHSYINDYEIEVQEQQTTSFETGYSVRSYIGSKTLYARTALRYGVGWFDAQPDWDIPDAPRTRYTMGLLDIDYQVPFTMGHRSASFTTSFHGQWTGGSKRLLGSDTISIGNRYTVRGFDGDNTLMGESGWYIKNELASAVKAIHGEIYIGLDVGAVYGPSTDMLVGRTIVGAVLGARGAIGKHGTYDVFVGTPIYKPEGYRTAKVTSGFTVGLHF